MRRFAIPPRVLAAGLLVLGAASHGLRARGEMAKFLATALGLHWPM